MYGQHDMRGESWCPDCQTAKPFVDNVKQIIAKNELNKEVYFLNVPIPRDKRKRYMNNGILKMSHVPTLIYFEGGREISRITENQLFTQYGVTSFVEKAYGGAK